MTDELLAYLIDEDLCPTRREEVERKINECPEWRAEFQRLQKCLESSGGDPEKCAESPPKDLVHRTCSLVKAVSDSCDQKPAFSAATTTCGRAPRWRVTEWVVGGGAAILLGCLLAPAILESRNAARSIACQDNLRWFGGKLFDYQQRQPNHELPPVLPGEHAGMFAIRLAESGVDRQELAQRMICPGSAQAEMGCGRSVDWMLPTSRQIARAQGRQRMRLVRIPAPSYAIRLGSFDKEDVYHQPEYTGSDEPLMADEPDLSRPGWASSNHRGGQWVLFENMAVPFRTETTLAGSGDHIYRSEAGTHAAPCDPKDTVLSRPDHGPMGLVLPVCLMR